MSSPQVVDNNDDAIPFFINPQYVNVTDIISDKAYAYVQTAQQGAYNKSLADITVPKWSFQYQFTGTRVTLYGAVIPWISGALPAAQYSVDGESKNLTTAPNTTSIKTDVVFYQSDWLTRGTHMLAVNVTTATSDAPYLFDYLAIDNTDPPTDPVDTNTTTRGTGDGPTGPTGVTGGPTGGNSGPTGGPTTIGTDPIHTGDNDTSSGSSKSSTSAGPIAGGVVGGVAVLALIAFGGWWLWKRNRSESVATYSYARTGQFDGSAPGPPHVDPFTVYRQADTPGATPPVSVPGNSYFAAAPAGQPPAVPPPAPSYYTPPNESAYSSSYAQSAPPAPPTTSAHETLSAYAPSSAAGSGSASESASAAGSGSALYGAAAAGAVTGAGAITYSTRAANGKAGEARMEALRAQEDPNDASSSVPPPAYVP